MHWTISKKILAGYIVSIVFVVAVCISVFFNLQALDDEFTARTVSIQRLDELSRLNVLLRDAETGQRGFVITGNENYLAPFQRALSGYEPVIAELEKLADGNSAKAGELSQLRQRIKQKFEEMDQTLVARRAQGFEASAAIVSKDLGKQIMDDIRSILDNMEQRENKASDEAWQRVNSRISNLRMLIGIGAPLAIIAMLAIGIITARSISLPIGVLTNSAGRLSKGEVQVEIPNPSGEDEVSRLSRSFGRMIETLTTYAGTSERIAAGDLTVQVTPQSDADIFGRSQADMITQLGALIGQVQQSGVQVNSSAVEIAAVAKQQQATASEVASTTTEISSTAREMSATSTELLKTADQVSMVAAETASLATQGREKLNRMEATIRQINEASGTVTNRLGVMNEKAGNINAVITTITKVADQTNLLSLNAAIEAEKAGEYGKGFSVVASEIRRLADQTAASTGDIERIVKELVSAVSAGVMGMDKFAEEVRRGAGEIGDTRKQLDEVIVQVQSLAPSVETLHEGMRAQTQGAEQISDALSQLGEAARQTADSIRDSSRAVDQLNEASRGLQGSISRFKIRS